MEGKYAVKLSTTELLKNSRKWIKRYNGLWSDSNWLRLLAHLEFAEADEARVWEVGGVAMEGTQQDIHCERGHHRRKHLQQRSTS